MALLFVNIKAGALSLIPNMLPIVLLGGLMGVLGLKLDIGTSMVAVIAIGIAVDGTIHFMSRYYPTMRRLQDQNLAPGSLYSRRDSADSGDLLRSGCGVWHIRTVEHGDVDSARVTVGDGHAVCVGDGPAHHAHPALLDTIADLVGYVDAQCAAGGYSKVSALSKDETLAD